METERNNGSARIFFINHATTFIQLDGINILTDPVFSRTVAMIVPRLKKPGVPLQHLPPIDLVLISHNHYDHLNMKSLRQLRQRGQSTIIVPRGVSKWASRAGFKNIDEMNWWETLEVSISSKAHSESTNRKDAVTITCVPSKHFSGRGIFDRNKTLFCGYVIKSSHAVVYFAGDSAYFSGFKEIAKKFAIDVALLPIGAYNPNFFRNYHMSPEDALQAFRDLNARAMIPIHWGTFHISQEPMNEPPIRLRAEAERLGIAEKIHILRNGKSLFFNPQQVSIKFR